MVIITVTLGAQHPFTREDSPDLFKENKISKLDKAEGWRKNNSGKWISAQNMIPKANQDADQVMDTDRADNFYTLKLSELVRGNKTYYLFTKIYTLTGFKYQHLKMGTLTSFIHHFYVFEKSELEKLQNLENKKTYTVAIKVKAFQSLHGSDRSIIDWYQKYPKDFKENKKATLYIKVRTSQEKNLAHFLIYAKQYNKYKKRFFFWSNLMYDRELEQVDKTFKTAYYEVSLKKFNKLFNINNVESESFEQDILRE